MSARDSVAVVTGGAGGIGREACIAFARSGRHVVVVDVNGEAAAQVADQLRSMGMRSESLELDVTVGAAVDQAFTDLEDRLGGVDVVMTAAGFPRDRRIVDMTDSDWDSVIGPCLFGVFTVCRAAARVMSRASSGRIINVASRAYLGNPGQANYSAAKAGVVGLTKSLAKELGRDGITVNAIAPGLVETDALRQHPKYHAIAARAIRENSVPRLGLPVDVAAAAVFLASAEAGFITGEVLHVSGGRFG